MKTTRPRVDIIGMTFGRLTVVELLGSSGGRRLIWRCICECGARVEKSTMALRSGRVKSCGCLMRDIAAASATQRNTTHGMSRSPTYTSWHAMHRRCTEPGAKGYENYGGRGITVCARWDSFANFLADMGERPAGMSIERNNSNGNYEPGNCRWATSTEQGRNTRSNRFLKHAGERLTVAEWSERTGLKHSTITRRLNAGWSVERALTVPPTRDARWFA